jgi:integrase
MAVIKDYADLFALNGAWRRKRAEKRHFYTDKSIRTREANFRNYVIPLWGERHIKRLTVADIEDGIAGLPSKFSGRPLAGCSVNRVLSVLSDFYSYMVGEGIVRANPVREVERCSPFPEKPRGALPTMEIAVLFPGVTEEVRYNILLPDTHEKLLKIWRTQRYVCAFLILKDTGLRPGELLALKWQDWDAETRFFPILHAIESGTRTKIKGTKTGATKPAIITERTAEEIDVLWRKVKPKPDDYIFCNCYGVPYSVHRLDFNFHESVMRSGLDRPELTPYWLRHTFNTRMLEVLPDDTVSHLMGHITESMRQRYRHADEESLRREAVLIKDKVNAARLY